MRVDDVHLVDDEDDNMKVLVVEVQVNELNFDISSLQTMAKTYPH